MNDLDPLLDAAAGAEPGVRIEFRDRIAAHGIRAIMPLRAWLSDARLGPFAVRTLERIAADPACRSAVVEALASVDPRVAPEAVARDIADAIVHLGGRAPRRAVSATASPAVPAEPWPGQHQVSAIEQRFHADMLDIFKRAGEATRRQRADGSVARGYWASYFLRAVRNHGGPEYAHRLLRQEGTTPGFLRLTEEGRLDLTMEALVGRAEYAALFTEEERRVAAHRLAQAGYQPPRG